jgi:predicted DNA-binding protein
MKNTIRVSYRLPIEVAQLLEEEAIRSRRTKTAVLIIAIEDHIARADDDEVSAHAFQEARGRVEKPVDIKKKR